MIYNCAYITLSTGCQKTKGMWLFDPILQKIEKKSFKWYAKCQPMFQRTFRKKKSVHWPKHDKQQKAHISQDAVMAEDVGKDVCYEK